MQNKIITNIDLLKEEYAENKDEEVLFSAWKKLRWLQSIKNSKNKDAVDLYNKVLNITGNEAEHPEFSTYMGGTWVGPTSPWEKEDFAKATPEEIIQKLTTFEDSRSFGSPSKEGLSRSLENYVLEDPVKCVALVSNLDKLENIFISSIYDGYSKVWNEKKHTPVESLLENFKKLLENTNILESFKDKKSKSLWMVNSFLRFVKAGVRDDENAFDEKFNSICDEIISLLVKHVNPSEDYSSSLDSYNRAINEPRGVLFETAILLALRKARISTITDKSQCRSWLDLLEIIEGPLKSQNKSEVSLYALIGAYYRQFLFLSKNWIYDNLQVLVPADSDLSVLRYAFMDGFCYVTAYVKEMYIGLRENGAMLEFLRLESEEDKNSSRLDRLQGRIIELSLIAYILDDEKLNSGILNEILQKKDVDEWKKLVSSIVPILGKEPEDDHLKKINNLMDHIEQLYITEGNEILLKHLSGVCRWLDIINDVNDTKINFIVDIASKNKEGYWDLADLIEWFDKYVKTNPRRIGELFIRLLNNIDTVPMYPKDELKRILLELKASGENVLLAQILRFYDYRYPDNEITRDLKA